MAAAANRLTDLSGEMVVPLEDAISKATIKLFPKLMQRYSPLAEKLKGLGLPGEERLTNLSREIGEVLETDASDAPQRLGKAESPLFESLKWASEVKKSLEQGLEATVRELRTTLQVVDDLPQIGVSAELKSDLSVVAGELDAQLQQLDFFTKSADFNTRLTEVKAKVRDAATTMQAAQAERLKQAQVDLQRVPEWNELTQQEQQELVGMLDQLILAVEPDSAGLKALVNRDHEIQSQVQAIKQRIEQLGRERLQAKLKAEQEQMGAKEGAKTISRKFKARPRITSLSDLDSMIQELQQLRGELKYAHAFELDLTVGE